jgi:hypothetical protein
VKATIEIPDDLYRLVKAKSSLEGRAVREVTEELYRRWLAEGPAPAGSAAEGPGHWLEDWIAMADKAMRSAPPGATARELLEKGRGRLERP